MEKFIEHNFTNTGFPKNLLPPEDKIRKRGNRTSPEEILEDINNYISNNMNIMTKKETFFCSVLYFFVLLPSNLLLFKEYYLFAILFSFLICCSLVIISNKYFSNKILNANLRKKSLNLDRYERYKKYGKLN